MPKDKKRDRKSSRTLANGRSPRPGGNARKAVHEQNADRNAGRGGRKAPAGEEDRDSPVNSQEASHDVYGPDPQPDNMGVDSDTPTGYRFTDVVVAGRPEDYYRRLGMDTLQVSVRGSWYSDDLAIAFRELRDRADEADARGDTHLVTGPGRVWLQVFPHGARPTYQVLLRSGDGIEIRGCSSRAGMPAFIFRFGARQCFEWSLDSIKRWIGDFLREIGFYPKSLALSEVHIRCDVPFTFVRNDLECLRGLATRNGKVSAHFGTKGHARRLQTITNIGGSGGLQFSIYNKRLEQHEKRGTFWPGVWQAYEIDPSCPIWRIEFRFKRKKLCARGLDTLDQLDARAIRRLWHHATREYLVLVAPDSRGRTDRADLFPKWERVAACGEFHRPTPITFNVEVENSHHVKAAAGHLAAAFAQAGKNLPVEIERIVKRVLAKANNRTREDLEREIAAGIQGYADGLGVELSPLHLKALMAIVSARAVESLNKRPQKRPYSGNDNEGGLS